MKHRRKMRQKRTHGTLWVMIVALFASCFIVYGAAQGVMGVMNSWLVDLPDIEESDAFNYSQKTRVYAADETTLLAEFFIENREPVTLEQVSPYVLEGTVATEDERFYEHEGVDLMGIARAVVVNLTGGLEGASTITQQFIRNTILADEANEISYKRKIREAQLAIDLEKLYSKDEVLLMYLNTINYGDGCWGIEAAAKNYFQKNAIDLSIAEAAALVGIPQSPTYLNPKENPDACLDRRNLVLDRMLRYGTINQEEYDAALADPLGLNPAPEMDSEGIYQFPYFTSYVRELLLDEFEISEVFKGGLRVYTTIDPDMQYKAEAAAEQQYAEMDSDLAVSLTAVDPATGYIKAMVGGKNYSEDKKFNLATQGKRHAGSSFKVFTLTSAIEKGIDPATKIDCSSPMQVGDWHPENYGGASYGIRTIQEATAISSNTGYVRLAQEITPEATVEMARRMGITTDDLQPLLSATLGAVGVTTMEMAGAYSTLATGGIQRDPIAITRVTTSNDEVVFQHEDTPTQALTGEVSGAVTEVLKTVMQSGGTASAAALPSGQVSAGKTGTSEDWRDRWLVGYTPQLVCATWIGNPDVERSMSPSLDCTRLWRNFMSAALEGQPLVDFPITTPPPYENPFNKQQSDLYDKKDPAEAPSVLGMTLDQAAEVLDGYEVLYVEVFSDTVPTGIIMQQEVADGQILLTVSKGPDPNRPTPTPEPEPQETPQPSP